MPSLRIRDRGKTGQIAGRKAVLGLLIHFIGERLVQSRTVAIGFGDIRFRDSPETFEALLASDATKGGQFLESVIRASPSPPKGCRYCTTYRAKPFGATSGWQKWGSKSAASVADGGNELTEMLHR